MTFHYSCIKGKNNPANPSKKLAGDLTSVSFLFFTKNVICKLNSANRDHEEKSIKQNEAGRCPCTEDRLFRDSGVPTDSVVWD